MEYGGAIIHCITQDTIDAFIQYETEKGASENMIRRFKSTLKVICDFLPDDKCLTKERLLEWRKSMEESGYASVTILNYVKCINRYLDFVGCSAIRFNKGKAKDISGMTFGYLTAIEPTGTKNRTDRVWRFQCQCGKTVELPATRVLLGNTLSCGCLKVARLKATKKYLAGTSIAQSMTENVKSKNAVSGYTGVAPKRDKWQAYINYKGVRYNIGCYWDIEDAVKARARAKELVIADAQGLLDFYTEMEKTFPQLPHKRNVPKIEFDRSEWVVNSTPTSAAVRSDNSSGYTGVSRNKGKWTAHICYQRVRYLLGRFDSIEEAAAVRETAEQLLKEDPKRFAEEYEKYPHYYL